jgi:hypothetical protein
MALGGRKRRQSLSLALAYTLSITARLLPSALLARLAGPIPMSRLPP